MSYGPPSNDPFQSDQTGVNPYAASAETQSYPSDPSGVLTQLTVVGSAIGAMALLTLLLVITSIVTSALGMNPQTRPPDGMDDAQRVGFYVGQYGGLVVWSGVQIIAIGGAVAMVTRRAYWLALAGAAAGLIPLCGPCLGVSIPLAIWAFVLLVRSDVRTAFT